MPINEILAASSSQTLSFRFKPGEDKFIATTNSESLFTFGDFRMERASIFDSITGTPQNISFGPFSTLQNLGVQDSDYSPRTVSFIQQKDLNLPVEDPLNYAYFSSFYSEVATTLQNVIEKFPYAIVSKKNSINPSTIYDFDATYDHTTQKFVSSGKTRLSSFINQGEIEINSGKTTSDLSLVGNYKNFIVQLEGEEKMFPIIKLEYFPNNSNPNYSYIIFEVEGDLDFSSTTTDKTFYFGPTKERMMRFAQSLTPLENHLLYDGTLVMPNPENEDELEDVTLNYKWPKTIDGFNPDITLDSFETYKSDILKAASYIDDQKTNIFLKTVIPENYLDFDSEDGIYRTMVQTYAQEFDKIKRYVDAIAYAHSINYNSEESIPDKMLSRLSNLLGWKLSDSFGEMDLFEYLVGNQGTGENSYTQFNIEVWRRILINIVWLYKKKGTRDALMFIFKLVGAPDCLIELNEFVYKINQNIPYTGSTYFNTTPEGIVVPYTINDGNPVNQFGYINYASSQYAFQEGGEGRGNGQDYINQWNQSFTPILTIDNEKVYTGDTLFFGTQNLINTKEIRLSINPAAAVECDIFDFYQTFPCACYDYNLSASCPSYSGYTVPQEYLTFTCSHVNPPSITGMTFSQYLDFIYTTNINPRNRKTSSQCHTSWFYPELRNIYYNYYLLSNPQSNRLTIEALDNYLNLLELQFQDYTIQLLPATTIFQMNGTVYRNTVFNRQKFVYKEGINIGSEFQTEFSEPLVGGLQPVEVSGTLSLGHQGSFDVTYVSSVINLGNNCSLNSTNVSSTLNENQFNNTVSITDIGNIINVSVDALLPINY